MRGIKRGYQEGTDRTDRVSYGTDCKQACESGVRTNGVGNEIDGGENDRKARSAQKGVEMMLADVKQFISQEAEGRGINH